MPNASLWFTAVLAALLCTTPSAEPRPPDPFTAARCGPAQQPNHLTQRRELHRAQMRWARHQLKNYAYVYQFDAEWGFQRMGVAVRQAQQPTSTDVRTNLNPPKPPLTIEALFEEIRRALDQYRHSCRTTFFAVYDADDGHPTGFGTTTQGVTDVDYSVQIRDLDSRP